MDSRKFPPLSKKKPKAVEEDRAVVFEGDASIRCLLNALEEKGVIRAPEFRAEDFDSAVLALRFRKPYADEMQMTVKTVSGNAADRFFWVSVEVAARPGIRLVDSQEMLQDSPALEFGEFWGQVSQIGSYRVAPTVENFHARRTRPGFGYEFEI